MLAPIGYGVVMTNIHFNLPPELQRAGEFAPEAYDYGPCIICLMFAKGDQVDKTEDQWKAALEAAKDPKPPDEVWIPYPPGCGNIRAAVCEGITDAIPGMLELVPLCWDHLGAMRRAPAKSESKLFPARGALPPGGLNGKGPH